MKDKLDGKDCFIDSNIWLYSFIISQDGNKSNISRSLIQSDDIIISTQVINEVCINLIRKAHFSEKDIQHLIGNFYERYHVVEINKEIIHKASVIREHHNFSFWDSHILASALYANAEILISEDMQNNFTIQQLTIINPFNGSRDGK
ncbi:MAG: PIN domain-containing protein [Desulfococcaceae bacterium]|jgi:predicted nucleic acid-binding protein|nr:PIN domain-containing protein [Desulfococcaceae bacterium]